MASPMKSPRAKCAARSMSAGARTSCRGGISTTLQHASPRPLQLHTREEALPSHGAAHLRLSRGAARRQAPPADAPSRGCERAAPVKQQFSGRDRQHGWHHVVGRLKDDMP